MAEPDASRDEASDAGRGVVFIAGAKIYFMVAGAAIAFTLPNLLGPAIWGAYALVAFCASMVNNVIVTGTIQTVSRFTAQKRDQARALQRAAYRLHLRIGLPIAAAFAAAAPAFAWFFHDPSKIGPLVLASFIVGGYAFYAVFVGTANGLRAFHKQAGLDVAFATLRATGIIGMAALGFGVYGAIGGWVVAVACILVVAVWTVGLPGRAAATRRPPLAPMARYFGSVAVYLVLLNLVMFVDAFLLKRLGAEMFLETGYSFEQAATAADAQVGYYSAVQQVARLSYQLIIAATFVIFPLISRAAFQQDAGVTHRYIRTTTRYSLIFSAAIAVVFAANPHPILDLPFRTEYADFGAKPLALLALGNVAFSLFAIAGTILNGAGFTRAAIVTAAVTLGCAAAGNAIAIPRVSPGPEALLACAAATSGAMVIGAAVGGWLLRASLGAFLAPLTLARVAVAAAAAIGVGRVVPFSSPLLTVLEAAVVGGVFVAVLIATRELTLSDLRAVTALRRRT